MMILNSTTVEEVVADLIADGQKPGTAPNQGDRQIFLHDAAILREGLVREMNTPPPFGPDGADGQLRADLLRLDAQVAICQMPAS